MKSGDRNIAEFNAKIILFSEESKYTNAQLGIITYASFNYILNGINNEISAKKEIAHFMI